MLLALLVTASVFAMSYAVTDFFQLTQIDD